MDFLPVLCPSCSLLLPRYPSLSIFKHQRFSLNLRVYLTFLFIVVTCLCGVSCICKCCILVCCRLFFRLKCFVFWISWFWPLPCVHWLLIPFFSFFLLYCLDFGYESASHFIINSPFTLGCFWTPHFPPLLFPYNKQERTKERERRGAKLK